MDGTGVRVIDMQGDEQSFIAGGISVVSQAQVEEWSTQEIATPSLRSDFISAFRKRMGEVFAKGDALDITAFVPPDPTRPGSQDGVSIITRVGDKADMAVELIRCGAAVVDRSNPFTGREAYRQHLALAEMEAQAQGVGGWRVFPSRLVALGAGK